MENKYVVNFFDIANTLKKDGLYLNKYKIKGFKVAEYHNELLEKYNISTETDIITAKRLLIDLIGEDYLAFLNNSFTLELDYSIERLMILQNIMKNKKENISEILGLIYYIYSNTLNRNLEQLIKASSWSTLYPIYSLNFQGYFWKRCPDIFNKYMLDLTIPPNYTGYYYEKKNLAHIAYLSVIKKHNMNESEFIIKKLKKGIFFKDLDLNIEETYLNYILSNKFDYELLDGTYSNSFKLRNNSIIPDVRQNPSSADFYTYYIKPFMINFIGKMCECFKDDAEYNGKANGFKFYHISDYRIGIAIKNDLNVEDVFPASNILLKKVQRINYKDMVEGLI